MTTTFAIQLHSLDKPCLEPSPTAFCGTWGLKKYYPWLPNLQYHSFYWAGLSSICTCVTPHTLPSLLASCCTRTITTCNNNYHIYHCDAFVEHPFLHTLSVSISFPSQPLVAPWTTPNQTYVYHICHLVAFARFAYKLCTT